MGARKIPGSYKLGHGATTKVVNTSTGLSKGVGSLVVAPKLSPLGKTRGNKPAG